MASCAEIDGLITPYLDGEVSEARRRAVDEHLAACAPCARRAGAEEAARRVLMVRAARLSTPAPPGLRERCAALAPRPARVRRRVADGWRRLGVAFAALVVAGVFAFGAFSHSPTLLAAELSLDHMKCFAFFEPQVAQGDAGAVSRQLEADYGWRFAVPEGLPSLHLALLGARRCFSTDGSVAHVLYRHAGRPVSLFMVPGTSNPQTRVSVAGRVATIWSRADTTYVLLGDDSEAEMRPIAEYFRSQTEASVTR